MHTHTLSLSLLFCAAMRQAGPPYAIVHMSERAHLETLARGQWAGRLVMPMAAREIHRESSYYVEVTRVM